MILAAVLVQAAAFLAAGRTLAWAWAAHERAGAEREARAAGLLLSVAEFEATYPPAPEQQDVADELIAVAAELNANRHDERFQSYDRNVSNGDGPPDAETLGRMRGAVAAQRSAVNLLDALAPRLDPAIARPAGNWPDFPAADGRILSKPLPHLNGQRELANLIRPLALSRAADGDHAAALRTARLGLGQSAAAGDGASLIEWFAANGVGALGAITLGDLAATLPPSEVDSEVAEEMRQTIRVLLDTTEIRADFERAIHGESLVGPDAIDSVADGDDLPGGLRRTPDGGPLASLQRLFVARSLAWLARPLMDRESAAYLRFMAQAARALGARTQREWERRAPGEAEVDMRLVSTPLAALSLASYLLPNVERAGAAHYREVASRHRAAAALAVRLYQADHGGALPPTLDALVPAYLPSVPRDPTSAANAPLGYDPVRGRIWTAGEDGDGDAGTSRADLLADDPAQSLNDLRGRFDDVIELR